MEYIKFFLNGGFDGAIRRQFLEGLTPDGRIIYHTISIIVAILTVWFLSFSYYLEKKGKLESALDPILLKIKSIFKKD